MTLSKEDDPIDPDGAVPVSPERRRFLARVCVGLGAGCGGLAVPLVGFTLAPLLRKAPVVWRKVGKVDDFKVGETTNVSLVDASPLPSALAPLWVTPKSRECISPSAVEKPSAARPRFKSSRIAAARLGIRRENRQVSSASTSSLVSMICSRSPRVRSAAIGRLPAVFNITIPLLLISLNWPVIRFKRIRREKSSRRFVPPSCIDR